MIKKNLIEKKDRFTFSTSVLLKNIDRKEIKKRSEYVAKGYREILSKEFPCDTRSRGCFCNRSFAFLFARHV